MQYSAGFDPFIPPSPVPISTVRARDRVAVEGVVTDLTVRPWAGDTRVLRITITDGTGLFTVACLGRTSIGGVDIGRRLVVGGAVIVRHGRLLMVNPLLWLKPVLRSCEHAVPAKYPSTRQGASPGSCDVLRRSGRR